MPVRDLLIVGAGPSGLATAIAAKQQGLDYVVVEKGILVNSVFNFPTHMVFFTTPELLEIGGLPLITPFEKPTRLEALRYYRRVVDTYGLQISMQEEVVSIEREPASDGGAPGEMVFAVTTRDVRPSSAATGPKGGSGVQRVRHARALVLAIGYYDIPNLIGVPGEDLPHVRHYYDEPHPYYRKRVVVVGGKNSAVETALELFRNGVHVTLVHRHATLGDSIKYWVRPDIENRIKEGSIPARFNTRVIEITPTAVTVEKDGVREQIPADAVMLLTGYHPDADLMTRAGVKCDPESLAPDMNPDTFETNVRNLFLAGGCIAGRNTGSIFIENGRFHGAKIINVLAERLRSHAVE
jgi:thioredoxin reductase (NADPH)